MGFRITFTDNNVAEEGHHVYRSQTSMAGLTLAQMPAPVTTLGPDVTEWEDGTVTQGETYYYRVGAFTSGGTVELISDEWVVVAEEVSEATAIFTFETVTQLDADITRVHPATGAASGVAVDGNAVSWGLDTSTMALYGDGVYAYPDNSYTIGWPRSPIIAGNGDVVAVADAAASFAVTGLDDTVAYDLSFAAARRGSGRGLEVEVAGVTENMTLNAEMTETLDFTGISPVNGRIDVVMRPRTGETYAYLSAVLVKGVVS